MRFFAVRHAPMLEQVTLAAFISEGHFARHIRRMRALHAQRQAWLVKAAQCELAGLLRVSPAAAGMHIVTWLPPKAFLPTHCRPIASTRASPRL